MKAKKKPLEKLDLDDLDIDEDDVVSQEQKRLNGFYRQAKGEGKILEGEIAQQVKELASLLSSEAKVI